MPHSIEVIGANQSRKEQFYDCGIQTVAESQLLVALWDGQPSRGAGGTQEIVSYAEKIGHPVAWIHSGTGELRMLNADVVEQIESHAELDFLNGLPDAGVELPGGSSRDLAGAWLQKVDDECEPVCAPGAALGLRFPLSIPRPRRCWPEWRRKSPARLPGLAVSAVLGIVAIALPAALQLHARQSLWARTRTAAEIARSVLVTWRTPRPYEVIGAEAAPWLSGHPALPQLPQDGR